MAERAVIGQYEVIHRLGGGGMAEIFLARTRPESGLPPLVALKRIQPELADDDDFAHMLIDEARVVSRLPHPGIAQMYDLGRTQGALFLVMEYVAGRDLSAVLKKLVKLGERIDPALAAWILARALEALGHAHAAVDEQGTPLELVHRDVSPSNVLVSFDGAVKLIDFGVAKATRRLTKTATGVLKGKFRYMSPEQAMGEGVDGRSDIFAAGIVLYELVAGRRLYAGVTGAGSSDTDGAVLRRLATGKIPSVRTGGLVPEALVPLLERALARKPADRWATAEEFAAALDRFARASGLRDGQKLLAGFVEELFPQEFAAERSLRKQLEGGAKSPVLPKMRASDDPEKTVGRSTLRTEQVSLHELQTEQVRLDQLTADGALPLSQQPTQMMRIDDGEATIAEDDRDATGADDNALPQPQRRRIRGTRTPGEQPPTAAARSAIPPSKKALTAIGAGAIVAVALVAVVVFSRGAPPSEPSAGAPPVVVVDVPAHGLVRVSASPPGEVFLDGAPLHRRTPIVDLPVPAGDHELRVVADDGRVAVEKVRVEKDRTRTVTVRYPSR